MSKNTLPKWILGSAFLTFGLGLQADTVIVGDPPVVATGNCDPFGCPQFFGLGTYQQVYSSSSFTGDSTIDGLTFYNSEVTNGALPAGGVYTLSFSYTDAAPNGLDTTNPNNNITSGSEVFFTGTLPGISDESLGFTGTPFDYNPAEGNLLLTVTVANPADHGLTLFLDQSSTTTQTTFAYFGIVNGKPVEGGNGAGGLITGFTVSSGSLSTPEPSSVLLMLGGVALIALRRRRGLL
jgi:hypothetical protein